MILSLMQLSLLVQVCYYWQCGEICLFRVVIFSVLPIFEASSTFDFVTPGSRGA